MIIAFLIGQNLKYKILTQMFRRKFQKRVLGTRWFAIEHLRALTIVQLNAQYASTGGLM